MSKERAITPAEELGLKNQFEEAMRHIVLDRAKFEAVKAFREGHHGVLLMDLKMPEMDGLQAFLAIQELCRTENWQMPSVVFCTGFIPPETVNQIVGDGSVHTILHKPVKSEQFITAVRTRLGGKK